MGKRNEPGEVGVGELLLAVLPPLVAIVVRREGVHLPHPLLLPAKIFFPPKTEKMKSGGALQIEPRWCEDHRQNQAAASYLELICE